MSHADPHRESSNSEAGGSSSPLPPSINPQSINPAASPHASVVPPPPPAYGSPPPSQADAPATAPTPAVPPPPPPRSTLPPVRPATQRNVASGVGAAKGLRWRGELAIETEQDATDRATTPETDGDDSDLTPKDHVTREAPPWLVSMVFHLVMLLILALITSPAGATLGRVVLKIGQSERETPAELTEFSISTDDIPNESDLLEDSEIEVDMATVFDTAELSDVDEITPVELGAGPQLAAIKPMFNGRTGAMKQALLAIYGGTPKTQEAVANGLEWLKRNQRKNGSWSMRGPYRDGGLSENETAATAMALLAFLGDGHTHLDDGEYSDVVERGMKFLVGTQDRSGFFARGARGHEKMYAQAQASIAICELYGMTKDSWLRPHAQLALDFAADSQSPEGGWRYEPKFDSDTSVTGWFVMALESGRSAGLDVDYLVLLNVGEYLDTAQSFEGAAYGYQARTTPSPAMTAEGLLCRQYIGWERNHPPLERGIEALLLDAPFSMSDRDVYYWYYATQVLHHFGGSYWTKWNNVMREELPAAQVKSGRESGSWAPQGDRWGRNSGRLYTTCLSIYCLEVYYRHMPLYASKNAK